MKLKKTARHPYLCAQPPSGGCVLKLRYCQQRPPLRLPAAFRRLCVETSAPSPVSARGRQPPSGGCVLKPALRAVQNLRLSQPPSGGCVLKHTRTNRKQQKRPPAAFRRLCVETADEFFAFGVAGPAAFRRLCVETLILRDFKRGLNPAAFRRLCVETL